MARQRTPGLVIRIVEHRFVDPLRCGFGTEASVETITQSSDPTEGRVDADSTAVSSVCGTARAAAHRLNEVVNDGTS